MAEREPDLLEVYSEARRQSFAVTARDYLASWVGNAVLSLASPQYRALTNEAIHRGLLDIVKERNPPFTEPLDDGPSPEDYNRVRTALAWALHWVPEPKTKHNIYVDNYEDAHGALAETPALEGSRRG